MKPPITHEASDTLRRRALRRKFVRLGGQLCFFDNPWEPVRCATDEQAAFYCRVAVDERETLLLLLLIVLLAMCFAAGGVRPANPISSALIVAGAGLLALVGIRRLWRTGHACRLVAEWPVAAPAPGLVRWAAMRWSLTHLRQLSNADATDLLVVGFFFMGCSAMLHQSGAATLLVWPSLVAGSLHLTKASAVCWLKSRPTTGRQR